jgi:uncharacterized protein (DUF1330 family)
MPAYVIGRIQITDPQRYSEYTKVTPGIIAQFGGRFLVRGGESVTLEGPEQNERVVIIEFPTFTAAKDFFHSEQYRAAKVLRDGAAIAHFIAIDGVVPT